MLATLENTMAAVILQLCSFFPLHYMIQSNCKSAGTICMLQQLYVLLLLLRTPNKMGFLR